MTDLSTATRINVCDYDPNTYVECSLVAMNGAGNSSIKYGSVTTSCDGMYLHIYFTQKVTSCDEASFFCIVAEFLHVESPKWAK